MNYTRITINQKEVGLKFGMYSSRYLADKLQNGFCFIGDEITEIGIAHVIYGGYLNNCAVKEIKPELTFENIVDHVEGSLGNPLMVEDLTNAVKVWTESQLVTEAVEESKKNKISRKSKS